MDLCLHWDKLRSWVQQWYHGAHYAGWTHERSLSQCRHRSIIIASHWQTPGSPRTANGEDDAQLDVGAESFWGGNNRQRTSLDIRAFNPFVPIYRNTSLAQSMLSQERDGEEKGLRSESKRNRTCIIFTTHFFYHRLHGNDSYSRLQEVCLFDRRKVWETLQQEHTVDPMQIELLTACALRRSRSSRHNHARHKIIGDTIGLASSMGKVQSQDWTLNS